MEIRPFRAFRFDETVVGNVGDCIAPPHDVIGPDQQEQLYQKSPHNIVRIIKGKTFPSDNNGDNQYTRAAEYLQNWIEKGALKQDSEETIYAYVQNFDLAGRCFQRLSFVALAKLEEFGKVVMPHEQILTESTVDRLNLKRATRARFGLVFMLYEDEQGIADKIVEHAATQDPLIDFTDEQSVRHRLFTITDGTSIDAVTNMMQDKSCIIADGHHRYTTGLLYSRENPSPAAKHQMLAFVNTKHEGLVVLATHRLLRNLEIYDFEKLLATLTRNFQLTPYHFDSPDTKARARDQMLDLMKREHDAETNAVGIYGGNGAFYVAVFRNTNAMDAAAPEKSPAWRSLDVAVLHTLILQDLLDIGEKQLAEGRYLEYVKDNPTAVGQLVNLVDCGQRQAVFFMNPTKIDQIRMVAEHGERMPQKSTYFYPKIFSGLTVNKL